MSSRDEDISQVPDQLMQQLLKGYDALHSEFRLLNDQRRELERKLAWAKQQYTDVLKRFTPDTQPAESKTFLEELDEAAACAQNGNIDWLEVMSKDDIDRRTRAFQIRVANDAREKLRSRQSEVAGVKIWSNRSAEKRGSVSASSKLRYELERDFTVPGTPSKLGCPFAVPAGDYVTLAQRNLPTPKSSAASRVSGSVSARRRSSLLDPIKGETCGNNNPSSPAASDPGSAPLCPIRFMDQHSPEEVAEYFEKHKHQIPRSHEVCIKRYQSNAESIKQLDAKYGSLVSMIQGLGQKHQPILAEKDPDAEDDDPEDGAKHDSVDKWAKAVSASLSDENAKVEAVRVTDERQPHFDRPLKEIRVGESPSRPWGITVPAKYRSAESAASEGSAITASPQELSAPYQLAPADGVADPETPAKKCPFDHTKLAAQRRNPHPQGDAPQARPVVIDPTAKEPAKTMRNAGPGAQMVFTGPVFIGYPMEQAVQFMAAMGTDTNK